MIRNSNVNRVFNDLDAFRNFCREYGFVFNEANLYRRNSEAYYAFERKRKGEYFKDFKWDAYIGLTEQLHGTAH
jgi:hypothetical protein